MTKTSKSRKGFTLVELIVVIAVLAILSVLAIVGFGNVQENARRTALSAEVNMVVGVLNNFNAVSTSPLTGVNNRITIADINAHTPQGSAAANGILTMTTPAVGAMAPMTFTADFESQARLELVLSWIDYTGAAAVPGEPDPDNPGYFLEGTAATAGRFTADIEGIRNSTGNESRTTP